LKGGLIMGKTPFKTGKFEIWTSTEFTSSTCGNPECGHEYVLIAVLRGRTNDYGEQNPDQYLEQDGGYYCPYCGSEFKPRPENY
jgi:hypothetical protein